MLWGTLQTLVRDCMLLLAPKWHDVSTSDIWTSDTDTADKATVIPVFKMASLDYNCVASPSSSVSLQLLTSEV